MAEAKARIAILGASGYTGAELLRLLLNHPSVTIATLTADRAAGQGIEAVFPHLGGFGLPALIRIEDLDLDAVDIVFCALPHGVTQTVIADLLGRRPQLKIIDLSADFRLADPATYAEWYGHAHQALDLQQEAVYGLSEVHRDAIAGARLVANPGCYTTTAELPLIPLIAAGQIDPDDIIIDAKSGVSGAGRALKQGSLFTEVAEGVHAYGIGKHRHGPEIEQELSLAAGRPVAITFTPHLMPMNRGILATIYVRLAGGAGAEGLRDTLAAHYAGAAFVQVLPFGETPATRDVRGTNLCRIGVCADRRAGRAILVSATDNLVKGAAGQAVQNMNLMCGLDESAGLRQVALFP